MRLLTRFRDPVTASQAASYLVSEGIGARAWVSDSGYTREVWLLIGEDDDRARAAALLAEYAKLKPQFEGAFEDQTLADLSKLDPSLAPPCPACREVLPMDSTLTACPACGETVDVPELIVQDHGPEALEPCFPQEPPAELAAMSEEAIRSFVLFCPKCEYALAGLPIAGKCPECGTPYSKRQMLGF